MTIHHLDERHHRWGHWIDQDERFWGPAIAALVFTLWMLAMLAIAYNAHKNYVVTQLAFDATTAAVVGLPDE